MSDRKPILALDFDGVIHDYKEGWRGGEIYGHATPGFFAWALKAVDLFQIVVYRSRSKDPDGGRQMREAIGKWSIDAITSGEVPGSTDWSKLFGVLQFASEKPPAFLTIDDRALTFKGSWDGFEPSGLLRFKPWNIEGERIWPNASPGVFRHIVLDMHQALGVKWGDDVYAEIKRLREIAERTPPTCAVVLDDPHIGRQSTDEEQAATARLIHPDDLAEPWWQDGARTSDNPCCSSVVPCSTQRRDPHAVCGICQRARSAS